MKNILQLFCVSILICTSSSLVWESFLPRKLLPKSFANIAWIRLLLEKPDKLLATELIENRNYPAETHEVQTEDGYYLTLHRIPSGQNNSNVANKPPVILFHSLIASSDMWLLRGKEDLAFMLADNGYDVWLINARGNVYSRKHVTLNPDTDKEFWDFSFDEMGKYDLPASIDHILNTTGQQSLFYIGHSMGCTTFLVLTTERPEYNQKVRLMQAFAPPVLFSGQVSNTLKVASAYGPRIIKTLEDNDYYEVFPSVQMSIQSAKRSCRLPLMKDLCEIGIYGAVGYDGEQQNNTLMPAFPNYVPAGASVKTFEHFAQILKAADFQHFDYGTDVNQQKYNSSIPSKYNLSQVNTPVKIYFGDGDVIVSKEDAYALKNRLPNCIGVFRVPFDHFNHLDFLFSHDSKSLLYDQVISTMNNYR